MIGYKNDMIRTPAGMRYPTDSIPYGVYGPCNCDSCFYSHVDYDRYTGIENWDCDVLDALTDKDTASCNHGFCPYWMVIE